MQTQMEVVCRQLKSVPQELCAVYWCGIHTYVRIVEYIVTLINSITV